MGSIFCELRAQLGARRLGILLCNWRCGRALSVCVCFGMTYVAEMHKTEIAGLRSRLEVPDRWVFRNCAFGTFDVRNSVTRCVLANHMAKAVCLQPMHFPFGKHRSMCAIFGKIYLFRFFPHDASECILSFHIPRTQLTASAATSTSTHRRGLHQTERRHAKKASVAGEYPVVDHAFDAIVVGAGKSSGRCW